MAASRSQRAGAAKAAQRRAARPASPAPARRAAPAPKPAKRSALRIEPLTSERWDDFVDLFGPRGACAGCWCTWARLTHAEFRSLAPDRRRAMIRGVVRTGEPPGLLAYDGETAVGWIAVAPRTTYRRYDSSRVLAPADEKPVWVVPCFFVARSHRGRGLTTALLNAACAHAASRGARWVEGYPIDTHGARQAAAFVWNGTLPTFRAAGFREIERRSPTRPIMRRAVRPGGKARARG